MFGFKFGFKREEMRPPDADGRKLQRRENEEGRNEQEMDFLLKDSYGFFVTDNY